MKELVLDLVGPVHDEPGCLYYEVYQDESAPDTFRIVDGWASKQAILDHVAHPNVAHVIEQLALVVVSSTYVTSLRVSDPRRDDGASGSGTDTSLSWAPCWPN